MFDNRSKLLLLFLIGAFCITGCSSNGTEKELPGTEGLVYYKLDDGTLAVGGGTTNYLSNVVIPSSHDGLKVTRISDDGFKNFDSLKSIIIPNSITHIPYGSFNGCTKLEELTLPDISFVNSYDESIKMPLGHMFGEDTNYSSDSTIQYYEYSSYGKESGRFAIPKTLKSITLTKQDAVINNYAFYNMSWLETITIKKSVSSIGKSPFYNCTSLSTNKIGGGKYLAVNNNPYELLIEIEDNTVRDFAINDKCTFICSDVFKNCKNLCFMLLPNGVKEIGYGSFDGCSNLMSVTLPKSLTLISDDAFNNCTKLIEVVNLSNLEIVKGKTDHGKVALNAKTVSKSSSLKESEGLYTIELDGEKWLINCLTDAPKEIVIPDGITSIAAGAFDSKPASKVILPNTIQYIDCRAFEAYFKDSSFFNKYDNALYLGGKNNDYLALIKAEDTSIRSCEINNSCRIIANNAFSECNLINSIVIPHDVVRIGTGAFSSCYKLVEIINESSLNPETEEFSKSFNMNNILNCTTSKSNTKLSKQNDFVIYTDGVNKVLVDYVGDNVNVDLRESGINKINRYVFTDTMVKKVGFDTNIIHIGKYIFNYNKKYSGKYASIEFYGTEEQLNAIDKEDGWNGYVGTFYING